MVSTDSGSSALGRTRVLGFLNLGLLAIVVAFMRPRLPPRKSGPLVDFSAFREAPYALFVSGVFFVVWAIYYTFYYVSTHLSRRRLTFTLLILGTH